MLLGVLLRFRIGNIPYMADIESMFYQVLVPPEQQTFLKFLWWPNGNIHEEPAEYQMCVHLFGATSSPSCANFALRQTVIDNSCQGSAEGNTVLSIFTSIISSNLMTFHQLQYTTSPASSSFVHLVGSILQSLSVTILL